VKNQKTKSYSIVRIKDGKKEYLQDEVVEEKSLSIYLNSQKIATLMCTPQDQNYLGLGFLFSEGLITDIKEVRRIDYNALRDTVKVQTKKKKKASRVLLKDETLISGCGKGKSFQKMEDVTFLEDVLINLEFTLSTEQISNLMKEFEIKSSVFKKTGGTHSAALADKDQILLFNEDIGRHNAVDKIIGESLIQKIPLEDKLLISSGRVSSDILLKSWRAKINLILSRSAPTSLAVDLAQRLGITIVGFARGKRMNIYSYPMRIVK